MSKYTKGPWRIGNTDSTEQDIFNADGSVFIGYVSNTNVQSLEENKANARLISAAPELLEALKDLVEKCHEVMDDAQRHGDFQSVLEALTSENKAKQAINKAEEDTMKDNNWQNVSLELSKALKVSGYKQEGSRYWSVLYTGLSNQRAVLINYKQEDWQGEIARRECYVAPTVAEMGEALPALCGMEKKVHGKNYALWYPKYKTESVYIEANTEANTRAKMLLYLVKEGLVKW